MNENGMEGYDWDKVFSAGNQPPKSEDQEAKPVNPGKAMSDEDLLRAMASAKPSDPVPPAPMAEEPQPEPVEVAKLEEVASGEVQPESEPPQVIEAEPEPEPSLEPVLLEVVPSEEVADLAAEVSMAQTEPENSELKVEDAPPVIEQITPDAETPLVEILPEVQPTAEEDVPVVAEVMPDEPVMEKGDTSAIPFSELDEIVEAAGKGPLDPSLSPYSVHEPEAEPEPEAVEVVAQVEEEPTQPMAEEANLAEDTQTKTTGDPEKDKLLSLFAKKGTKEPKPKKEEEVKLTLSELNTADTNRTNFDAHKDTEVKINKFSGGEPLGDTHIDEILHMAVERRASDIHITADLPPMLRIDGEVVPLPFAPMQPQDTRRLLYDTLDDEKIQKFESTRELDFGYPVKALGRFRVNMFVQRGAVGGVLRVIPMRIPLFEELGLPPVIKEMSKRASGLILVTGPTGSGKSTTIATIIDDINTNRRGHIMTIEDPIEYLHQHKQCIVNQREMHSDTYSFHNALRAVLREDPDIILVGELRDLETIEAALTLAETGHLVFGTLHTRNAPSTIDRIIDVFPPDSQEQIRVLLANTIEGVVSQQLLPRLGGGRCASIEVMIGTPAIKNLVREGKTHQMQSILETSGNHGMQTMDASLAELYRAGKCEFDECHLRAIDRDTFVRLAKAA